MKKLVALLVRHGDTVLNDRNVFRSRLDPALNKKGIEAAEKVGRLVQKKYAVSSIVSSPMLRAVQTADIIAEALNVKVSQNRGLIAWNLGSISGKDKKEYAKVLDYFIDNPKETVPEGESLDDLEERTWEFFKPELKRDPQDEPTGTAESGYDEGGPYHCADCVHKPSKGSSYCNHPKVVNDPANAKLKVNGLIQIDREHGCCEYVRPKKGPETVRLYVTHTSNVIALENMFHGNRDGRPETGEEAVSPGGLAEVWEHEGEYSLVPVLGEQPAAFGE
jgi:broad specificity phosphatase PhoE